MTVLPSDIQPLIDAIPIRHNSISSLMFLGVVLGFFLSLVIFLRATKDSPIRLFGWALFTQSIVCLDTYLCYTGMIKYLLYFNDSTEPFVLLIPTTIYFFVLGLMERKPIRLNTHWWHFILPLGYALSQIGYYASPLGVKLNAYLGAYYNHLPKASSPLNFEYSYIWIKDEFRWLILFSFLFYLILSLRLMLRKWDQRGTATKHIRVDKYTFTRNTLLFFMCFLVFLFAVYLNHEDDGGDHYIVMAQAAITLTTCFFILSESRFFENSWLADKYETLTTEAVGIEDLEFALQENGYYTDPGLSLNTLSKKLGISSNTLSRTINSQFGMNFNDYINLKRINEAKSRLVDGDHAHLTIEAVGLSVGFKSKSAFYSTFKKHTGTSPTAFIKQKKTSPHI